ncbi:MAG: Zn-dependent exopeptidase M28 [Verrucomicrobia bacterium]|nr:Zn-dependent exopeptidase M28 [Verrucomicrobiota bacterium]MBU1735045.1 Zn-dependent exopeptidase M28 [Verrucomicrobiota bacterium]MBU1856674.1 Zn-dependent exopeptidase M28 [Verrucomicrobiota bacterium]
MTRYLILGVLTGFLLVTSGCRPALSPKATVFKPIVPRILDADNALAEARALVALGPRAAGTPGARQAAGHLLVRLQAAGVQSTLDAFTDETPDGKVTFWNVMGVIPAAGPDSPRGREAAKAPWIFLGSHFDTKSGLGSGFEGANDSASSSGLLLELARVLQAAGPLPVNIGIAFFDGEECRQSYTARDGLHGSVHAVRALCLNRRVDQVRAVIILDMIGDRDLTVTIPRNSTSDLTSRVFRAAAAEKVRDKFALMAGAMLDDHQPFLEAGMPSIDLIDFEYGSAPGRNDYWHTPQDTLDKLSAESLGIVGRVVIRVLNDLMMEAVSGRQTPDAR